MNFVNRNNSIKDALADVADFVMDAEFHGARAAAHDEPDQMLFRLGGKGLLHASGIHRRARTDGLGGREAADFKGKLKFLAL